MAECVPWGKTRAARGLRVLSVRQAACCGDVSLSDDGLADLNRELTFGNL